MRALESTAMVNVSGGFPLFPMPVPPVRFCLRHSRFSAPSARLFIAQSRLCKAGSRLFLPDIRLFVVNLGVISRIQGFGKFIQGDSKRTQGYPPYLTLIAKKFASCARKTTSPLCRKTSIKLRISLFFANLRPTPSCFLGVGRLKCAFPADGLPEKSNRQHDARQKHQKT